MCFLNGASDAGLGTSPKFSPLIGTQAFEGDPVIISILEA